MSLTAEQIEKSRAEFEGWLKGHDPRRFAPTAYDDQAQKWKAWLARQETLCVELPKEMDAKNEYDDYENGYNDAVDSCLWNIKAAGISYK